MANAAQVVPRRGAQMVVGAVGVLVIVRPFGPMADTLGRLWGARIGVSHAENFIPVPLLGRMPSARVL